MRWKWEQHRSVRLIHAKLYLARIRNQKRYSLTPNYPYRVVNSHKEDRQRLWQHCQIDILNVDLKSQLNIFVKSKAWVFFHKCFFYPILQILLQQNCEKIQPLLQRSQHDYNLAMLVGALFSCFGIILILLAFVLWRWVFHIFLRCWCCWCCACSALGIAHPMKNLPCTCIQIVCSLIHHLWWLFQSNFHSHGIQ